MAKRRWCFVAGK